MPDQQEELKLVVSLVDTRLPPKGRWCSVRVDVNAPKGVHVSAEAGGLFKDTEATSSKSTGADQAGDQIQGP
jgi:hypothetical protein